jgi:hypothetical protein
MMHQSDLQWLVSNDLETSRWTVPTLVIAPLSQWTNLVNTANQSSKTCPLELSTNDQSSAAPDDSSAY